MSHSVRLALLTIFILALMLLGLIPAAVAQQPGRQESEMVLTSDTNYEAVTSMLQQDRMERFVKQLASFGSRVTGYPGCNRAAGLIEQTFREIGLQVTKETFSVLVPMPKYDAQGRAGTITVPSGKQYGILPLWPNLVQMPKTPPEGLSGKLIYASKGALQSFNGQDVIGSIVMLDFDSGREWFNAPLLGAKAVLFVEPRETIRGEAEQKFLSMPVNMPRFWVPKATADLLQGMIAQQSDVKINLKCDIDWKKVTGENILGHLKGTDPRLSKQQVVLQAYYDSISIAPDLAPGAENACSIAALMELARAFKANPPKRSVTFLANAGHFEAMAGEKAFIARRMRGARSEKYVKRLFGSVRSGRRGLDDAAASVWEEEVVTADTQPKTQDEIAEERIRALGRVSRAIGQAEKKLRSAERVSVKALRYDPNLGKPYERQLEQSEITRRQKMIQDLQAALPAMKTTLATLKQLVAEAKPLRRTGDTASREAALAKIQAALYETSNAMDFSADDISLWMAVDLSSHNRACGVFFKGYFYNYREDIQWKYSQIGKKCREYGDIISRYMNVPAGTRFVDGINALKGKNWQTYMSGKLALSNEVATLAGVPAVGFATINDSRPWVDTPLDLPKYVEFGNLFDQTTFLSCLLQDMVNIGEPRDLYDLELEDNFVEVRGRLVLFDPAVSTFPDEPIPGAVAVARTGQKTAMGVRCEVFDKVGDDGRLYLSGLPNVRAKGGDMPVEGYLLDAQDGHVSMAPDMGVNGNEAYPFKLKLDQDIKPVTCVMFNCKPMAVFDMVDQRFFELLREIHVYDATTDAIPYQYGYCLPLPPQQFESSYEPVALVFCAAGTKVKLTMGASVLGLRMVLVNPSKKNIEGEGYLIDSYPSMFATPYLVARDMSELDEKRINDLETHGIKNNRVTDAHVKAKEYLVEAAGFLRDRVYDRFLTSARSAWSYESRAYPDVRATANDVIKGVLFYLAMLMPFAFFAERLLIGSPDIKWQIAGFFGIFMAVFILIALVHPAFAITFTPVIILLAFIILALTMIVVSIIVQKFEEQMKEMRFEQSGVRTADMGRLSASSAAFSLGISNMRRRSTRTILTCLTLVLLTFTVLSCTSVVTGVRTNRILLPYKAPYDGIMIRDKTWNTIGEPTARVMANEFSDPAKYAVAPRAWYFSSKVGDQSFVDVQNEVGTYSATAMVGMAPEETHVSQPQKALMKGGRWFEQGETLSCIIPEAMAEKLGITVDDAASGSRFVSVFGVQLRVIGIMDSG
ncbi:MAG: M28 family peptidase, partial [Bacteroidota bacterium]